jgi:hypothetical protein
MANPLDTDAGSELFSSYETVRRLSLNKSGDMNLADERLDRNTSWSRRT